MDEIKALEKLREKIRLDVNNPWSDLKGDLLSLCDKVEREIAERYIELPTDEDGVPIKVGDECWTKDTAEGFEVSSIEWNGVCWSTWSVPETRHLANRVLRHKPRTVENVLEEFLREAVEQISKDRDIDLSQIHFGVDVDKMAKYAAEIRELLGVIE